jgi:hypothetical protein
MEKIDFQPDGHQSDRIFATRLSIQIDSGLSLTDFSDSAGKLHCTSTKAKQETIAIKQHKPLRKKAYLTTLGQKQISHLHGVMECKGCS